MPDNLDEILRVRVSKDLKNDLQKLADNDGRHLAQLARKILVDYARTHRNIALHDEKPPIKYAVPGRSKLPPGKTGIAKKTEN
jgi:hypothetical protein